MQTNKNESKLEIKIPWPYFSLDESLEIFLFASCYRNQDKLRPGEPLGSYADFTFTSKKLQVIPSKQDDPNMFLLRWRKRVCVRMPVCVYQ